MPFLPPRSAKKLEIALSQKSSWWARFAAVACCVHLHIQSCALVTDVVAEYDEYSPSPVLCLCYKLYIKLTAIVLK